MNLHAHGCARNTVFCFLKGRSSLSAPLCTPGREHSFSSRVLVVSGERAPGAGPPRSLPGRPPSQVSTGWLKLSSSCCLLIPAGPGRLFRRDCLCPGVPYTMGKPSSPAVWPPESRRHSNHIVLLFKNPAEVRVQTQCGHWPSPDPRVGQRWGHLPEGHPGLTCTRPLRAGSSGGGRPFGSRVRRPPFASPHLSQRWFHSLIKAGGPFFLPVFSGNWGSSSHTKQDAGFRLRPVFPPGQ